MTNNRSPRHKYVPLPSWSAEQLAELDDWLHRQQLVFGTARASARAAMKLNANDQTIGYLEYQIAAQKVLKALRGVLKRTVEARQNRESATPAETG